MNLSKFIHMLNTKTLFFCNLNQFEDKYEGEIPIPNEFYKSFEPKNKDDFGNFMMNTMKHFMINRFAKADISYLKKYVLVNCWHINEYESASMWKTYASYNPGIAIQSTTKRLEESLKSTPDKYLISKIKYKDYSKDILDSVNLLEQFITKRIQYNSDQELRIISSYSNKLFDKIISYNHPLLQPLIKEIEEDSKKDGFDVTKKNGKYISVDLKMIEKIYVSSLAPEYFIENIRSLVNKYHINENKIIISVI